MNFKRIIFTLMVAMVAISTFATKPKYIFYFIGDGMGMAPVMATEAYNRLVHNNENPLLMTSLPNGGWAQTWSASSPVTDSAAAGTALATGHKTKNGMLGMNPDTVAVNSIAVALKEAGYGIGIVTNCAADDATPGAFYAHVPKRSMYYEVGRDAAFSGVDFLAGASLRGDKDKNGNPTDLYNIIEQQGVQVLRGADGARQVATSSSSRIFLLNPLGYGNSGEMGFIVDGVGNDGVGLTLSMAMDACFTHLEKNSPDKFFMMVEGGLIDHVLHDNDGSAAVREIIDFDNCIRRAYEFYQKHPEETLIVITADHDTGGMSVGCKATGYNAFPANVDAQKLSKGAFSDYCVALLKNQSEKAVTWPEMQQYLKENLGFWNTVTLKDAQTQAIKDAFDRTFVQGKTADEKGLYKTSNAFAAEVFRVYSDATGWGFTTPNHTGNPVPVFAIGDGAQAFARMQDNIQIAPTILRLAGVEQSSSSIKKSNPRENLRVTFFMGV